MPKRKMRTIHIGLAEAKKLGKPLYHYLMEDVEDSIIKQLYAGRRQGKPASLEPYSG